MGIEVDKPQTKLVCEQKGYRGCANITRQVGNDQCTASSIVCFQYAATQLLARQLALIKPQQAES